MVHRRTINGDAVVFGNHGALWGNAMTWFDHDTGTIWSQPLGEAIVGPLKGTALELLPSTLIEWGEWKQRHPDTKALEASGERTRFSLEQMSIVVAFGEDSAAYPIKDLIEVVNDAVSDVPVAIVLDPTTEGSWTVFSRTLDNDTIVDLVYTESGELLDTVTNTTFDSSRGTGIAGPRPVGG